MLVLTRRAGESIVIGDEVRVVVLDVRGDTVRLGIEAPRSVQVHRAEVYAEVQAANAAAASQPEDLAVVAGRLARLARPSRSHGRSGRSPVRPVSPVSPAARPEDATGGAPVPARPGPARPVPARPVPRPPSSPAAQPPPGPTPRPPAEPGEAPGADPGGAGG